MSDGAPPSAPETVAPIPPAATHTESPSGLSVWAPPVLIACGYLAFWQIAPRIRTDAVGAMILSTVVGLALIVWFSAQFARGYREPASFALSALTAAAALVPLQLMLYTRNAVPPWRWILFVPGLPDLLMVWLAASLGGLLSFILRGANMIPPVAAVLALVDIWTVFLGPVGKIVKSDSSVARSVTNALTATLPAPTPTGAAPIPPHLIVGFADFLFIAFFVSAISRFVPSSRVYRRMLLTLIAILGAYMLVVFFSGWNLPALLPLAVIMIALHWRYFQYSRSELFALLYAGLFIVLIGAGFWYMNRSGIGAGKPGPPTQTPAPIP